MKVKVLHKFRDRTSDLKLRKAGEILEVTKERGESLIAMGLAEAVKENRKEGEKG